MISEAQQKCFIVNLTNKNLAILETKTLLDYQTKHINILDISDN